MPPRSSGWLRKLQLWSGVLTSKKLYSLSAAPEQIRLRQYQEECIQAVLSHLQQGHKRLGISLATGSGKTVGRYSPLGNTKAYQVIFTQLIDRVSPHEGMAEQTLVLAHRQELVEQAARHCSNAYPAKKVEIEMGSMHASGFADITVASIQSLVTRMAKYDPARFKLLLVDEAHHIVSGNYMKTLEHFGLTQAQHNSPALVGVSATFSRHDGLRLGAAIDHIVYHKDYIDMIGEKWLSDVIFTTVRTDANLSNVRRSANGDFLPGELSKMVNTETINDATVRIWLEKAKGRKSTLVFCVDLNHVYGITNTFRKHGIDARFITGDTHKLERSIKLDTFRRGEFPVLVNCGVFTEGTDIPNIDCILLARPTRSRNLLVQMIGRGMRLHPGKVDCHIIDMVASLETGIVTVPTLFGLEPDILVRGATIGDMMKRLHLKEAHDRESQSRSPEILDSSKEMEDPAPAKGLTVTFTDYNSIFELINDTTDEQHIRSISPHAWVYVGEDRHVLSSSTGAYLKMEKQRKEDSDYWEYNITEYATKRVAGRKAQTHLRPRRIAVGISFIDAVHAADTYAKKKYPFQVISRYQAWRNRPATEAQVSFLKKIGLLHEQFQIENLTKGKAGDMITKLKHGARGRFSAIEASRRKLAKAEANAAEQKILRDREYVSVGPVLG